MERLKQGEGKADHVFVVVVVIIIINQSINEFLVFL